MKLLLNFDINVQVLNMKILLNLEINVQVYVL